MKGRLRALLHRPAHEAGLVPEPAVASTWTGGPALASRGATVFVLASLGVAWVGGFGTVLGAGDRVVVASAGTSTPIDAGVVVAGEQAQAAVVAWLTASDENPGAVDRFYGVVGGLQLPERGAVVDNTAVASVVPRGPGLWSITVGADVAEAGGRQVRRYLQVPVVVSADRAGPRARVAGLPAPVPAPVPGDVVGSGYGVGVDVMSPLGVAVGSFLGALTTGVGDIARYESPGVVISAIAPPVARAARVAALEVGDVDAEAVASAVPGEGQQVRVLATVRLVQSVRQVRVAMYALTMCARGGRWEVARIDPTPALVVTGSSAAGRTPTSVSSSGGPAGSSQEAVTPSGVTSSK